MDVKNYSSARLCISRYVQVSATQQTDQRTSKIVDLFFAEALISNKPNFLLKASFKMTYFVQIFY